VRLWGGYFTDPATIIFHLPRLAVSYHLSFLPEPVPFVSSKSLRTTREFFKVYSEFNGYLAAMNVLNIRIE
jgi:hypothetical protein